MKPIRVLIADDHAIVRNGLKALLVDEEGIEVIGEAADGRQAVSMAERLQPGVVLMDVVMPIMDGAAATASILRNRSEARVLAMSGSELGPRIFAVLRAGALGYVSKSSSTEELVEAIGKVHRGQPSMAPELTLRLLEDYDPGGAVRETLTGREIEIVRLLAKGLSNQEIADRSALRAATVRTHVGNIFGKLGVNNRVEATLLALRDGLTTLDQCLRA